VGRRRLHDDPLKPLPKGLYQARRQYRARSADGTWVYFSAPYEDACRAFRAWRQDGPPEYHGSVAWLLDWYLTDIAPTRLRPRTLRDYRRDAETIKVGLGKIPADRLAPVHIATWRDERAKSAKVHVNRELAVLRSCYTAAAERGLVTANPVPAVRRMKESKRERLVTDAEYLAVYGRAVRSVQIAMILGLRTLQRMNDVLHLSLRDVHRLDDGRRVLRFRQFKTGAACEILVEGELERVVDEHRSLSPFVHTQDGKPYTVDGIGSMFRRYCGPGRDDDNPRAIVADFGLRDLRAKGATDLYRAGVDVRQIQALLGHRSVRTTEIYLKSLVPELARPNNRPVIAEVKHPVSER
jgi:integrase